MESKARRLPLGVQHFEKLRKGGYVYVDKTDMIWEMANGTLYNYLSRPRRFGKSLLTDTLKCYFEGKRELFEGLKIMDLEQEWVKYPVLHFDMSGTVATAASFANSMNDKLARYEAIYGESATATEIGDRFSYLIRQAHQQTGQPVVVLIDEYDSPVRNTFGTPEHDTLKDIYRGFLSILKTEGDHLRFVFITGIAKFTQLSLFSALNTLENWSFDEKFDTICGLTDEEIDTNFVPELEAMAQKMNISVAQLRTQLKDMYDGYHFSDRLIDMYNPTSLLKALSRKTLECFWASDGASKLLPEILKEADVKMDELEDMRVSANILRASDYVLSEPAVFLYQLGYVTIKSSEGRIYHLGIPNTEVHSTLSEITLPSLLEMERRQRLDVVNRVGMALDVCNLEPAMLCLKQIVSAAPYTNKTFNPDTVIEDHFRFILSTVFSVLGYAVECERHMATGRIDMVVKTPNYIYVMELKMRSNGGVDSAEEQMRLKHYADAFAAELREVIRLAIEFDEESRTIVNWGRLED